jgi:hypothetical protein
MPKHLAEETEESRHVTRALHDYLGVWINDQQDSMGLYRTRHVDGFAYAPLLQIKGVMTTRERSFHIRTLHRLIEVGTLKLPLVRCFITSGQEARPAKFSPAARLPLIAGATADAL